MPGCLWPKPRHLAGLSDHQREELRHALVAPLALLTGTPGTGKTYTVASIVRAIQQDGGADIALCAPTGKAAVRMAESLLRNGVTARTQTIHSLLEIGRNGHDGEGWGFQRNAKRPLPYRFVIVDEASMLDADLAASLLSACQVGTHVLLVGDPHQLPPVGHGAPLRDMIAAGVPCARLSEIRRNAGMIVEACAAIKDGKEFRATAGVGQGGDNLRIVDAATPQAQLDWTLQLMRHVAAKHRQELDIEAGLTDLTSPLWETQCILATNTKGPLNRRGVNRAIQDVVNADGRRAGSNPFRVNDKIICLRNGWYMASQQGEQEAYIANGEMGWVTAVEERVTTAWFPSPLRSVRIPMSKPRSAAEDPGEEEAGEGESGGAGCNFDLGWAITCHKSQGSEWPTVIVLLDDSASARRITTREWLYTAVSRASGQCILIGNLGAAQMMARRPSLEKRKTMLQEQLRER